MRRMGFFDRKKPPPEREDRGPLLLDDIRAEWPQGSLDTESDLVGWHQGIDLYTNSDYPSMMRCATLLAAALAHDLYHGNVVPRDDVPDTVLKIIWSSTAPPPDGKTFAPSAEKAARLAMAITRELGFQPMSMGGNGAFDHLIQDPGRRILLDGVVNRPGEYHQGLQQFFAVPPSLRP
jgi:hypothetical protein